MLRALLALRADVRAYGCSGNRAAAADEAGQQAEADTAA